MQTTSFTESALAIRVLCWKMHVIALAAQQAQNEVSIFADIHFLDPMLHQLNTQPWSEIYASMLHFF